MSNFLNLNLDDLIKGFVVAFLSSALTGLIVILDNGALPNATELKSALVVGITSGLSYLLKNLLTNSKGQIAKSE